MEIEGQDGSKTSLIPDSSTVFGRGSFCNTNDKTVSREHILLHLQDKLTNQVEPNKVVFQVIGKNPVWIRSEEQDIIKIVRKGEKGEVAAGDSFCLSSHDPVWFHLKEKEKSGKEKTGSLESFDVSLIDPVKEFGFLVIGHEFDCYPKQRRRDTKKWDWFLEEPGQYSDDDDDESFEAKKKRGGRQKRKKGGRHNIDDEDWTGESEDDTEDLAKFRKVERLKYGTRSKDKDKLCEIQEKKKSFEEKKNSSFDVEDEDDDSLGGFIVNEEEEEEEGEETDEEDEFIDDEDDDEA